jgi:hypothetical protein
MRSDVNHRRDLVAMLAAGGMFRDSASKATVLHILADASVFRAGGVLVGTEAFSCLANMLGVRLEVVHDTNIPIVLDERPDESDLLVRLRAADPAFFAVPGLDPRDVSTSFRVRGRDLGVDFLTPDRSHGRSTKPVRLTHLGIAAQPLYGLDYLIEDAVDGVVVGGSGIRVNVPSPARFAFHKLGVSTSRSVSDAAKSRKDVRQATQILEVLADDRPRDITLAYAALQKRKRMTRAANEKLKSFDAELLRRLRPLLKPSPANP